MARRTSWLNLSMNDWRLGYEASTVIGLRTLKLAAGGPAAQVEAERMVAEKVETAWALQTAALTGGLGFTPAQATARTIARYRRKVRANQRRLTMG